MFRDYDLLFIWTFIRFCSLVYTAIRWTLSSFFSIIIFSRPSHVFVLYWLWNITTCLACVTACVLDRSFKRVGLIVYIFVVFCKETFHWSWAWMNMLITLSHMSPDMILYNRTISSTASFLFPRRNIQLNKDFRFVSHSYVNVFHRVRLKSFFSENERQNVSALI